MIEKKQKTLEKETRQQLVKKPKVLNLLGNKNIVRSANYFICGDSTLLGGKNGEVLFLMDLTTHKIIGSCYTPKNLTVEEVCETVRLAVKENKFLPPIKTLHTDQHPIFQHWLFLECLLEQGITPSRSSSDVHSNQSMESLNRTLKRIIRQLLDPSYKSRSAGSKDPLESRRVSAKKMVAYVKEAINIYHDRPHRGNFGLSPNDYMAAMFLEHGKDHPTDGDPLMVKNNDSIESQAVILYNQQVVEKYNGDWRKFFLDWRATQENWQKSTTGLLEEARAEAKRTKEESQAEAKRMQEEFAEMANRYQTLYAQALESARKLSYLESQAVAKEASEQEKQLRKEKRKRATKLPVRDTITPFEFEETIKLATGNKITKARRRLGLALLYLTGLRVSNLLELTVDHITTLRETGEMTIPLIKGGPKRHKIQLSPEGEELLRMFDDDIEILKEGKPPEIPVFTVSMGTSKGARITRVNLDLELNAILRKSSILFGKYFRTHSFRATFITDLLETSPLDVVKEVVGHLSVLSTMTYKQSTLSADRLKQVMSKRKIATPAPRREQLNRKIKRAKAKLLKAESTKAKKGLIKREILDKAKEKIQKALSKLEETQAKREKERADARRGKQLAKGTE
jgi:site-specific recombinase XerD